MAASAPNLRYLRLECHPEDVRPSWAQFVAILRGASSLEKLTLNDPGPSGDPQELSIQPIPGTPASSVVQLPRLAYTNLRDLRQTLILGLLRRIHTPALEHLRLSLWDDDYTELAHELARPSAPPYTHDCPRSLLSRLTRLTLVNLPCDIGCIETLYGKLQGLRSLRIFLEDSHLRFLNILGIPCTLPGRSGVWVPQLEELRVRGTDGRSLRKVIKRRRDLGAPLDTLNLGESDPVESNDFRWLKKNVEKLGVWFQWM